MTETADVVIIGSGIVGQCGISSCQQGCTNVLVSNAGASGQSSTGKSMGGVRAQFSTAVNIQMSRYRSLSFEVRRLVGHPADYRPRLFVVREGTRHLISKANRERQIALGVKTLIGFREERKFVPQCA